MHGRVSQSRPLKAPGGSNRLAKIVGLKLRRVREGRELSIDLASAQLGISSGHYAYLERGKVTPGPNLCKRILAWMTQGVSYEGAAPLSEAVFALDTTRKGYRKYSMLVPMGDAQRFSHKCRALGMSGHVVMLMLMRNFVANKGAFATMKDAVEAINEARIKAALTESPELRDILAAEIPLCIKAGATMTQWHELEEPPIVQVANLAIDEPPVKVAPAIQEETDEDDL